MAPWQSDMFEIQTMPTPENSTELCATEEASDAINLYVPPILIVLGVTANVFVIITMRTKFFRSVSTSVYLRVGAMNDSCSLLVSLTAHWLYVSFPGIFVRNESSHIMCRFFNFYGWGNTDLGILLTTAMTAERAVVIAAPFGAAKYCSVKRARIAVGIAFAVVICKDVHLVFTSDMVPAGRSERLCDVFPPTESYRIFWLDVWPWIHLAFLFICGISILISNVIIIYNVRHSAADRHSNGQKWRQLVPMLLSESLLLMLLTFPFTIHLAILAIRIKHNEDVYADPESQVEEKLVFSITFYMLYSNKCVNFFMYCITGSRFREALRMVLMTCCCRKESWRERLRSTSRLAIYSTINVAQTRTLTGTGHETLSSSTPFSDPRTRTEDSNLRDSGAMDLPRDLTEERQTQEVNTVSRNVVSIIEPYCYIDIIYHF